MGEIRVTFIALARYNSNSVTFQQLALWSVFCISLTQAAPQYPRNPQSHHAPTYRSSHKQWLLTICSAAQYTQLDLPRTPNAIVVCVWHRAFMWVF